MVVMYSETERKIFGGNKNSREITNALYDRHSSMGEVCLTEVELGRSGRRADFWTATIGLQMATCYEVKVSLSDFKRDKKWHFYLPYCIRFYFACPTGLLYPDQIPAEAGLVWIDSKGGVTIQKNAPHRRMRRSYWVGMMRRLLMRYMSRHGSLVQPDKPRPE